MEDAQFQIVEDDSEDKDQKIKELEQKLKN